VAKQFDITIGINFKSQIGDAIKGINSITKALKGAVTQAKVLSTQVANSSKKISSAMSSAATKSAQKTQQSMQKAATATQAAAQKTTQSIAAVAKKSAAESTTAASSLQGTVKKIHALGQTFRDAFGVDPKFNVKGVGDDIERVGVKMKGFDTSSEQGAQALAMFRAELEKTGKQVDIYWKNQTYGKNKVPYGEMYAKLSDKDDGGAEDESKKVGGLIATYTKLAATLTKVGAIASAIAAPFKMILNIYLKLISVIGRLVGQLIKIPVAIIKAAASAMLKFGKAILSIPVNAVKNIGQSLKSIGTIIAGMVGFYGIKGLGRQFADLISDAGAIESVRVQFENFTQQARAHIEGFSSSASGLIKDMQDITGGALNMTSMLKNSNMAFALIGEQVGRFLPQMLGIAQAAALSTGQDLQYMFESMVKGIGRLSTRWLDNTGISIDATTEYERYAETIDKSVSSLTQAEKVQAFLNATMREGANIMARTGDVTLFLGTQMAALKANLLNTRDAVISNFAPLFTVLLGYINEFASKSTSRMDSWTSGFISGFAQIARTVETVAESLNVPMDIAEKLVVPFKDGHEQMGHEAASWAINALTWGANVGSQFVVGIVEGFMRMLAGAMNAIAAALSFWFSPGSPPRIAPEIDSWGYQAIGEWVDGMLSYPVSSELEAVKKDLVDTLGKGVRDELYQEAVDSLAAWTKGLSIADMDFLAKSIDRVLTKAKQLNDELTKSYKKQRSELFKMAVLNKDPTAIRNKIAETAATEARLQINENEIDQLEDRKELIRDQLGLMRSLLDAAEKASKGGGGGGGGGGAAGGGGALEEMLGIELPLMGTGGLGGTISGIQKTLSEIFDQPLQDIKDAFNESLPDVEEAWIGLKNAFEANKPAMLLVFSDLEDGIENLMKVARNVGAGFLDTLFGTNIGSVEDFTSDIPQSIKNLVPEENWPQMMPDPKSFALGEELGAEVKKVLDGIKLELDNFIEEDEVASKIVGFFEGLSAGITAFVTEAGPDAELMAGSLLELADELGNLFGV